MVRFATILAVAASMLSSSLVSGFSNMPGTCRLSGMKAGGTNPHGFAPSTDMTYTLTVTPSGAAGTYTVTLGGTGSFTGLLLFAQDQTNATRFGSFMNIPSGYAPLTTCGDINPASNTLGHNSATPKTLPVSFTWNDMGYPQPYTAIFSSIVMSGTTTKWYTTNPVVFTGMGAAAMMSASTSPMMAATTSSMSAAATTAAASTTSAAAAAGSPMSSSAMPMNSSMSMASSNATASMMSGSMSNTMMASAATSMPMASSSMAMTASSSTRLGASSVLGLIAASFMLVFAL